MLVQSEENPISAMLFALKSPESKRQYPRAVEIFHGFCETKQKCPPPCDPTKQKCPPPCDPTKQKCPPPITCGSGTHLENGKCVRNDGGGPSSSSASASATATVIGAEVSSCRLDGNAHGMQQKFDSIKYRACGLYPNGQVAYSDGFILGCTQVGNTQQLCQALVLMNTQQTPTVTQSQTQPNTQSATQQPQPAQPAQPTQAIQPSDVS